MYRSHDEDWSVVVLKVVICIVLIIIISAGSRACSRSDNDMVYIQEGYCYDVNTKIIYKENIVGRYDDDTVYTVYYDGEGNVCKYDISTGNWVKIDK